jgi:hypothetical protein
MIIEAMKREKRGAKRLPIPSTPIQVIFVKEKKHPWHPSVKEYTY